MTQAVDVAVVGATSLVGEALLEILDEREFPFEKVFALAQGSQIGKTVSLGAQDIDVEDLAGFDFGRVRLAFFATGAEAAIERARAAGCTVIDASGVFRGNAEAALVVPEVNAAQLGPHGRLIANPSSTAILLSLALKPLHDAAGVERVNVVSCHPVSGAGREGVEELAKQTADLLNFREAQPRVFPAQIAFNLIPQVGVLLDDGRTGEEAGLADEIRHILGDPAIQLNVTALRAPVLYGHSASVQIQTRHKLDAAAARALLAQAAGVTVIDQASEGDYPTPAAEISGKDDVFVGRIREDASQAQGLNLWLVTDHIRKGTALNMVQIAEVLVRDYL